MEKKSKVEPTCIIYPGIGVNDVRIEMTPAEVASLGYIEDSESFNEGALRKSFIRDTDDVALFFDEDDKLSLIICDETCIFNGPELIGISKDEVVNMFGLPPEWGEPDFYADGSIQVAALYYSKGLVINFEADKVFNVMCVRRV